MSTCHATCPQTLNSTGVPLVHDLTDAWRIAGATVFNSSVVQCDQGGPFGDFTRTTGETSDFTGSLLDPPSSSTSWFRFTAAAGTTIAMQGAEPGCSGITTSFMLEAHPTAGEPAQPAAVNAVFLGATGPRKNDR